MVPDGGEGQVGAGVPVADYGRAPVIVDRDPERPFPVGLTLWFLLGVILLAAGHVGLHVAWPDLTGGEADPSIVVEGLNPRINLTWYIANVFTWAGVVFGAGGLSIRRLAGSVLGYAGIVWLLWPGVRILDENALLLIMAVLVYGGLLRKPYTVGYLYLFLLCQRYLPAYLYPAFLLSALLYTTAKPFVSRWRRDRERFLPVCHLSGLILLTGLLLPIIFFCTQTSPQDIQARLQETDVRDALGVSLLTSAGATLIVLILGVPMAYAMVRRSFPGRGLIDTLIDLPIVVPPPIAGIALLAFLGPLSPLGQYLDDRFGLRFFDSVYGIIAAQTFVASPYLIRASMVAFSAVDVRYENVARTLGATTFSAFLRITLPLSLRGILIGAVLTWFRAMAEFGSLRILANNPKTLPILAFERQIELRQSESQSVGVMIMILCLGVIIGMWILRSLPTILGKSIGTSDATR